MNGLKYKVGDYVRIKSLDWYNKNKDNYGAIYAGNGFCFWKNMTRHCGEIMKITTVKVDPEDSNKGFYFMENSEEKWTDGMIECLVEEETNDCEKCGLTRNSTRCLFMDNCPHNKHKNIIEIPKDYVLKDENGNEILTSKIILEKKKKEYPKTYEECCEILEDVADCSLSCFACGVLNNLQKLLLCRAAYWKIAGEEMGLETPWEPDYTNTGEKKFAIWFDFGEIKTGGAFTTTQMLLSFPTAEMRDSFKENFDPDIKKCKMFL